MAQIVYVEPGDVLVFSNTGPIPEFVFRALDGLRDVLGIARIVLFEDAADISVVRPDPKADEVDLTQLGDAAPSTMPRHVAGS